MCVCVCVCIYIYIYIYIYYTSMIKLLIKLFRLPFDVPHMQTTDKHNLLEPAEKNWCQSGALGFVCKHFC